MNKYRYGWILLSVELFGDLDVLKAVYSVFYPVHIEDYPNYGYGKTKKMYGYSELFDEVVEENPAPGYDLTLFMDLSGILSIKEVTKKS